MSKIKGFAAVLAAVAMVFVGNSAHADAPQPGWTAEHLTADPSCIRTDGNLVYAYAAGNYTANGVHFSAISTSDFPCSDIGWTRTGLNTGKNCTVPGVTGGYADVMQHLWSINGETQTITLRNLTAGRRYLVQIIGCNQGGNDHNTDVYVDGYESQLMRCGASAEGWPYGGTLIGVFDATDSTYSFDLKFADIHADWVAYNAIQVRDLTPVTYVVTKATDDSASPEEGSLREILSRVQNGDIVTFDSSLAGQTINLAAQIVINKTVSIVGPSGRVTLSGGWNGSGSGNGGAGHGIFYVNASGRSVELSNLNLVNSYGVDDKSNRALYVPAVGSVTVTDCSFSNNYCAKNGGAVRLDTNAAYVKFDRCLFADNMTHNANGGAIYSEQAATAYLIVDGCSFRRNCAATSGAGDGGASIFSTTYNSTLVVVNSEFSDGRTQSASGGAIKKTQGPLYVVNTTFRGNYIYGESWGPAVDGRGQTYFVNCTFAGNMQGNSNKDSLGSAALYLSGTKALVNSAFCYNWVGVAEGDVVYNNHDIGNTFTKFFGTADMRGVVGNGKKMVTTNGTQENLTLASTLADMSDSTKLFADYELRTSIVYPAASGVATVALKEDLFVPALLEDGSLARVVAIDPEGELVSGGSLVKVSADYLNCAFSENGGATWTALYGDAALATELITADQRGVAYPVVEGVMQVPIGAACVTPTIAEKAAELEPGDWLVCPLTGDPSDIVTLGDLVVRNSKALAYSSVNITGDDSLSGLSFSNVEIGFDDDMKSDLWSNYRTEILGNCGLDNGYGALMASGWAGYNEAAARTIILNNLEVGKTYLIQGFVHDANHPDNQLTVGGGTITYGATSPSDRWYYGGTFVHVFTANTASYTINLSYSLNGSLINGLQLREFPEPVDPDAGTVTAEVDDYDVTITLTDVVAGSDAHGLSLAPYNVWAALDDGTVARVVPGASATTTSFSYEDLDIGSHTCTVYIENSAGDCSEEKEVEFLVVSPLPTVPSDTWIAKPLTGADTDVLNSGTTVYALTAHSGDPGEHQINGVDFDEITALGTSSEHVQTSVAFDDMSDKFGREDFSDNPRYPSMMCRAVYSETGSTDGKVNFTFSGLTAGDDYIVQLMVHANSDNFPKQLNRMYAPDGQWIRFGEPTGSGEWKYGGTIIGRFTATGTSQTFTFAYDPSGWMQINALQLRTAPKTVFVKTTADAYPTGPRDSLRAALAAVADGGRIVVDPVLAGQTISLVGVSAAGADTSFVIDKSVTIEGNGVIIDGGWDGIMKSNAGGRIFTVPTDVDKVTIRNLTMQNGHGRGWSATSAFYNGGAMGAFSPVRFENCEFIHNCATDDDTSLVGTAYGGGAIYAESDVEIVDCEFSNNVGGNGNSAYGGAICMNGGSLLIERTAASGDYAGSFGGGFLYGENMTSVVVRDSSFSGHHTAHTAGAFWIKSCNSVFVERTRFVDCHAPSSHGWGGAVLLGDNNDTTMGGKAVFRDCEFTDCSGDCGGAVRTKSDPTLFVNCTFTGCAASKDSWGPAVDSRGNDFCVNCTFTGNMYTQSGNGNNGGYAVCRYGTACRFLNTVGTFNYYRSAASETSDLLTGRDFYDNNFINTICNGKAADRTTDLTSDSVLFASTAARSSINCWGTEVALRPGVIVPTLSELGSYPSRVVEIAEGGLLDGTGYPVKINADYTWIQYSSDGGSTWTDFYKAATADGSTLALVAADQRGVAYPEVGGVMKAPIGATCVSAEPLPETPYEVTGNPKVIIDGGYVVYAWRDASQTGTLKIPSEYSSVRADYLVVGGGGAGGFCRGGGGGGGGVVYETVQDLASGTYAIIVGAGGVPDTWPDHYSTASGHDDPYKYSGSSTAGTDGGRSAITIEGTVVGEALGGGGGGTFITGQDPAYTQYGSSGAGRTGANAGGSANKTGSTAALDASLGFAGGAAYSAKDASSGGGGGAGSAGYPATAEKAAGNGGDGVPCSITGSEVYYGGGGGGGLYDGTAGIGGLGGGGNGGNQGSGGKNAGMTAGVNGLGGGGGGASGAGNKWVATVGAPGGSGTVIIRLPLDPSSQTVPPSFRLATPVIVGNSATITLNSVVIGTDATGEADATSYNVYAYTGNDPAAATVRATSETGTTFAFTESNLVPADYIYSVFIVNDANVTSKTVSTSFSILPPVAPSATVATPAVDGTDVTFNLSDVVLGTDPADALIPATSYDVLLAYAPDGSELPELTAVLTGQTAETCQTALHDLAASTTFAYKLVISNNLGGVSTEYTGTFTTGVYVETVNKLAQKLGAGEWIGVPLTGKPSDVVSYGEEVLGSDGKVRAYINGNLGTDATISFVNFRNGWNTTDLNMVFSGSHTDYGDTDVGACCYRGLMAWGWYGNNSGDDTYTLKNLVPGQSYLIQIFVHDGRTGNSGRNFGPGPGNIGNRIYFGEATKETALPERGGVNWYYGGTLIHAFVATGTDYTFVINSASGSQQINAIQLRTIPMPKGSPMIGALTAAVEQGTAQVTLGSVVMGTDDEAQPATSYDVYVAVDDADPVKVLTGQEDAPVSFFVQNLAVGEHDIKVFIENNFGAVSPTNSAAVTIATADPDYYFPIGNWRSMPMTVDYSGLSTFGALNYALASSAGGNRVFTVNTIPYLEAYRDSHSGRTYYYSPYFETDPVLNGENDNFGQEDTSGDALNSFLRRAWTYRVGSGASGKMTIMLKQLEPGVRYTVQLTAHNNRTDTGDWSHPDGTMTAPDGVTAIQYGTVNEDETWKYGGSLIGSFIASNTTHAFTFTYSPLTHFQLNTLQVRKTGAAPTVVPDYPTLGGTSVFISRGAASINVSGLAAGVADGACDIYLAVAEDGEQFVYSRVLTGVEGASCTVPFTGVEEDHSYVYSVYAVNPVTHLASEKVGGSFTIGENPGIPDVVTVEPLIRPGLVQAKFGAGELFDSQVQPPLVSNLLAQTTYESSLDYTYGALMAGVTCDNENVKVLNTYTVTQWNWDNTNTVFAYEGEIYLQKGQRLVIYGRFDDGEAAVVDGVTLLAQGNSSGYNNDPAIRWVVYTAAETGWYPLNAWVWDYTGGKTVKSQVSALAYNLEGITDFNGDHLQKWKHLEDTDGKGSFLRFMDPSKTLMTLGKPETNGVDVTINVAFTDVPEAAEFVAYVSMADDGGLDPLAWDDVIKIADIPAGDTSAADYTVKGLASYPFVRFAIESEGSISTAEHCRNFRQMSCAVGFGSDGLSLIVTDPVFAKTNGTFNVIVADTGAVTPLNLNVEVSSDPAFGSTVYQGTIDGIVYPGRFPVAINGLTPGTTYYVRVKPTTAGDDAWVVSAPIETEVFGNLRINEIMASNGDTFKTKNGRSGLDWIEIYNGTDEEVDLAGWYLYDDPSKAQSKWKKIQGACVIPVHGYGIVWCDKDYTDWDAANEAWSEIGLSTSGETVFLAKPDGTVVDTVTFGTQMKEISYGVGKLPGSDEETHVFFKVSTPGAENGEYGYGPMTPTVAFTVPHGYKTAPIDVEITCADDPDADIYYTLDGTQPTATNPSAVKYTTPIHITSTTILRAGVPQENTVLQIDSSATYIYLNDVLAQGRMGDGALTTEAQQAAPTGFPVTQTVPSGYSPSGKEKTPHKMRYGMIQSIVNGPDRDRMLRGFTNTVATLSIVMDPELLFGDDDGIYVNSRKYQSDGSLGERPMLLELIDPVHGASQEFSVPGGLRLRGSGSLSESNPKHSLRFFFRGQYGMAKLNFPLFGEEGADEFSKVDLRCSQNYSWAMDNSDYETFIHEVFSRDSQRDLGQLYTRSRYYNLFINGQYWGLYQTQERGDKDFAETYNGGNEDYYDCIKTSSSDQWHYNTEASDGTLNAWRKLQGLAYNGFVGDYADNYYRALGLNPDGTRNTEYPVLLNPENLMAYVTIAHFVCDSDGPISVNMDSGKGGINNLYANRYQIDGGSEMDGFWFLRHDAEHSMGVRGAEPFATWAQYDHDPTGLGAYEACALNPDVANNERFRGDAPNDGNTQNIQSFNPYQLHWQLAKNPVYKRAFADYFYKNYLKEGGAMTPAVAKRRFEARMAEIDDVIVSEAARWSQNEASPKSREKWLAACSNCLDFIDRRIAYMKPQYQARGWYPMLNVPEPDVAEGLSTVGTEVTFSVLKDDGVTEEEDYEVVYTTDGSDPADSETAKTAKKLTLTSLPMTIKARARKTVNEAVELSALQEVTYRSNDGYTFVFEGEYPADEVQEIAPTGSSCVVIFKDANIPAGIKIADDLVAGVNEVTFEMDEDTTNTVGSFSAPFATLNVSGGERSVVEFEGADTLVVVSNLLVTTGTFSVKSDGVTADETPVVDILGWAEQKGGTINVDLSTAGDLRIYGLYLRNKSEKDAKGDDTRYAKFGGGEFIATVGGWKSAAIYGKKGSVDLTFKDGETVTAVLSGPEARFAKFSGKIKLNGGEFDISMPEECSSITNARVFKSDKEITIKDGHYVVNVPGPGAEIFSVSKNEDGDDSIITVKGGTFELEADDDCFNADDRIDIQGGLFYAVSLNNDVFDSNGDMLVSGGTIMAYATAAGHEAFDVDPMVQGEEVSTFLPHRLTINGGTIFATGGKNAAWPTSVVAGEGVNLYMATGVDADGISEMYASIQGSQQIEGTEDTYDVTTTAKLPTFQNNNNALLMTCPNMAEDAEPTLSDVAPTEGSQDFHELYISSNLPSNHEYVRMYEIYGSTVEGTKADDNKGDVGEYIILTNVSDKVVQLAGLKVTSQKVGKAPSLILVLAEGTIPAGGTVKLEQSKFGTSWGKITNGAIYFEIINDEGDVVQSGNAEFNNELFPGTDGGGAALRAKRFDNETPLAATVDDWESTAIVATGGLMFYVW